MPEKYNQKHFAGKTSLIKFGTKIDHREDIPIP